ncbi:uncharacterized protein [Branchiostoma lanceolatum]|uniref:uncharacterized protein isoform X2 n=1 Tax=Branchiostoma lanceolatum TaxID=7740 RepID=UPI003455EA38
MDLNLLIEQTAQLNLSCDKHPQCFDEEVSEWISNNCPDWKKPNVRKTYMIPPTFHDIQPDNRGDLTEKRVFDTLEKFGGKTEQPMFVVHSHKFHELFQSLEKGSVKNDDAYWCRGETDFVIVHRTLGIIFLQVKAAANKTARAYEKAKEQLEKDQESLTILIKRLSTGELRRKEEKKIEQLGLSETERKKEDRKKQLILKELGRKVEAEMNTYPGFVVMPNCPRDKAGGRPGCFREDIDSAEHFEEWWQKNMHRAEEFSQDMYELMAIWFVGPRVLKESCLLGHVIDRNHSKLIKLTMDQLSIMTQDVPKQDIAGPAGSGKTWLLLEKAKQVAGKLRGNERILIMCFNRPLSLYLAKEFQKTPKVVIKTFNSILNDIKGERVDLDRLSPDEEKKLVDDCVQKLKSMQANSHKYEHVFVDEGQDMFGIWMDLVNLLHADSDEERRYRWVFFDNNQSVHYGTKYRIPKKIINNAKLMNVIVRNTHKIFECSQKCLSPSVGAKLEHRIVGLPVKWIDRLPTSTQLSYDHCLQKGVELVKQEIADLDSKSVLRSDIVVLTSDKNEGFDVGTELARRFNIPVQNAEQAIRSPDRSCITVDSIRRFKGLERKVVILFDPPLDDERSMDLNYVAMSRCFCLLVIVTTREKRRSYEEFTLELREGR